MAWHPGASDPAGGRPQGLDDSGLVADAEVETAASAPAGPAEDLREPGAGGGQAPVLGSHVSVPPALLSLLPDVQHGLRAPGPQGLLRLADPGCSAATARMHRQTAGVPRGNPNGLEAFRVETWLPSRNKCLTRFCVSQ